LGTLKFKSRISKPERRTCEQRVSTSRSVGEQKIASGGNGKGDGGDTSIEQLLLQARESDVGERNALCVHKTNGKRSVM